MLNPIETLLIVACGVTWAVAAGAITPGDPPSRKAQSRVLPLSLTLNPDKYIGQEVVVSGYIFFTVSDAFLATTEREWQTQSASRATPVQLTDWPNDNIHDHCGEGFVEITGTFDKHSEFARTGYITVERIVHYHDIDNDSDNMACFDLSAAAGE